MATLFVTGNRNFAQPGIDGGIFTAPNPVDSVIIVTRMFRTESLLVNRSISGGQALGATVMSTGSVIAEVFNTVTSSGAFIQSSMLLAGQKYAWIAVGVGG